MSISAHRAGISCRRPHKCPQPAAGLFPTSLLSSDQHASYLALPKPAMSTQKRLVLMGESCPGLSPQHHLIKLGSEEEKPIQNTKALLTTRSTANALSQPQIKPQANLLNCFFPDQHPTCDCLRPHRAGLGSGVFVRAHTELPWPCRERSRCSAHLAKHWQSSTFADWWAVTPVYIG